MVFRITLKSGECGNYSNIEVQLIKLLLSVPGNTGWTVAT